MASWLLEPALSVGMPFHGAESSTKGSHELTFYVARFPSSGMGLLICFKFHGSLLLSFRAPVEGHSHTERWLEATTRPSTAIAPPSHHHPHRSDTGMGIRDRFSRLKEKLEHKSTRKGRNPDGANSGTDGEGIDSASSPLRPVPHVGGRHDQGGSGSDQASTRSIRGPTAATRYTGSVQIDRELGGGQTLADGN